MRKTNRGHRISASRKKHKHPIEKGLLETGIDQYMEGKKFEDKSDNASKR